MKNIKFKYTCFVYGLLSLLSIGLNSSNKNNFLRKFCLWFGKCHNSILILQLFLLKNQINSENFKYCKGRGKWVSWEVTDWQPIKKPESAKRQIPPQVKEKIVLDYYNHFGKFLLTFTLYDLYVYLSMYINNLILVFLCKTFLKKSEKLEHLCWYH